MNVIEGMAQAGVAPDVLATVESYWRALRGARRLPARTDVDPRQIDAALPSTLILEEVTPSVARIRVAGEEISRPFGFDLRGMPLSSLFKLQSRAALGALLDSAFSAPALVSAPLVGGGHILLLPLEDRLGQPTRALCAISVPELKSAKPRLGLIAEARPRIEPVGAFKNEKGPAHWPALRLVVNNT